MNPLEFFISKLKAMQVQGFKESAILDQWRIGLPKVIIFLEQELIVARLSSNTLKENKIRQDIKNIKTLDEVIKIGLLE